MQWRDESPIGMLTPLRGESMGPGKGGVSDHRRLRRGSNELQSPLGFPQGALVEHSDGNEGCLREHA